MTTRPIEDPHLEPIRIDSVRLTRVEVPLAAPFRSSAGAQVRRDVVFVEVLTPHTHGWGEDVALPAPTYTHEFAGASWTVLGDELVPRLLAGGPLRPVDVRARLAPVKGWEMAKAALETAVIDACLRTIGMPLATALGATRRAIAPGVAVGLHPTTEKAIAEIAGLLDAGYRRVKLKIEPGNDVELVAAVRSTFGDQLAIQVDANSAYRLDDADHLSRLDHYGLLFIEQPLADDDLVGHAELARRLTTPICLDESITSLAAARTALALGACSVINVKPARVGGLIEAARIHDLCVECAVPAWVGGMLETGVGRAAALALAALPGFTFPPDLSASDRYLVEDVTEPFVLRDGLLDVPHGAGIGRTPSPDRLAALDPRVREIRPD